MENEARHSFFSKESPHLTKDLDSEILEFINRIDTPALSSKLKALVQCTSIQMYFKDRAIARCYPLNRFLALLFQRWMKLNNGWELIIPGHEVESVQCSHEDDDHFDQPHTIFFSPPNVANEVTCRIVVPRLGIDPNSVHCDRAAKAVHHLLPYWLGDWKPNRML